MKPAISTPRVVSETRLAYRVLGKSNDSLETIHPGSTFFEANEDEDYLWHCQRIYLAEVLMSIVSHSLQLLASGSAISGHLYVPRPLRNKHVIVYLN